MAPRLIAAWLIIAAVSILIVFQVYLHSDSLFLDSLMTDLFRSGGSWRDWKFTPAPAYLPDMLLYALSFFIFPGPVVRIVFVCLAQALLLAGVCTWLAVAINRSLSSSARVMIALLVATTVLVAANSNMWLFFNSTNNHFGGLLFSLLSTGWVLSYLERPRIGLAVLVVTGGGVAIASTAVFLISFSLPLLFILAVGLFVFHKDRRTRQLIIQIALLIAGGVVFSKCLDYLLLSHDALSGRAPFSLAAFAHAARLFLPATKVVFYPDNLYTFTFAIFIAGCFVWLLFRFFGGLGLDSVKSGTQPCSFSLEKSLGSSRGALCTLFLLVALPCNVIGAIISGGFADLNAYRYFSFPICLAVVLCVAMADCAGALERRWIGRFTTAGLVLLPIIAVFSASSLYQRSGRNSVEDLLQRGRPYLPITGDAVAACLDRAGDSGFEFGSGIADFWNARGVQYKTSGFVYILPILKDATPFFHMMTLGPLRFPQRYAIKPFNFAILRASGTATQFELTPETVGRLLPEPRTVVKCDNSDSEIWLFDNVTLDEFVKRHISGFLFSIGEGGEYVITAASARSETGRVFGTSRVATGGIDTSGYLTFGPYKDLEAGHYRLSIEYSAIGSNSKWDVGRFNDSKRNVMLASGSLIESSDGRVEVGFDVPKRIRQFEARTWFDGAGTLTVKRIVISKVPSRSD